MLHKELLIEIHDALRKAPAFALSKCAKRRTTGEERCERAYPLNVNVARTCSKHFKEEDIDHTCPQKENSGSSAKRSSRMRPSHHGICKQGENLKRKANVSCYLALLVHQLLTWSVWKASAKIICFCFNIYHMDLSMPNSVESIEMN